MTSEQAPIIVGFGEALIDVLPSGEVVGGAPLNFAFRASELTRAWQWPVALVTRIGKDPRGKAIEQVLERGTVDMQWVQHDPALPTGYVDIQLQDGHGVYQFGANVAWDNIQLEPSTLRLAQQAAAVCFGTLAARNATTRATLRAFLAAADRAIKVLDINLRLPLPSADVVLECLQAADVLKCNEDELVEIAQLLAIETSASTAGAAEKNEEHWREVATHLLKQFSLRAVFLTRGEAGCQWQDNEQIVSGSQPVDIAPWPTVPNADTVGAGDATSAALVVGLVAHWTPQRIVDAANLMGAFAANTRGPTTAAPIELLSRINTT